MSAVEAVHEVALLFAKSELKVQELRLRVAELEDDIERLKEEAKYVR